MLIINFIKYVIYEFEISSFLQCHESWSSNRFPFLALVFGTNLLRWDFYQQKNWFTKALDHNLIFVGSMSWLKSILTFEFTSNKIFLAENGCKCAYFAEWNIKNNKYTYCFNYRIQNNSFDVIQCDMCARVSVNWTRSDETLTSKSLVCIRFNGQQRPPWMLEDIQGIACTGISPEQQRQLSG